MADQVTFFFLSDREFIFYFFLVYVGLCLFFPSHLLSSPPAVQRAISTRMQYSPFASDIELPFYTALASLKIDHDKLNDSPRAVLGLYEIRPADPPNASCRMQVHGNALSNSEYVQVLPSLATVAGV